MSLRVWLPLNGDLRNNGLSNITVTNNGATIDNNGKIGKCYYFNGSSDIRISMPSNMTTIKNTSVAAWIKSTGSVIALGGISNDVDYTKSMVTLYTSGWQFASGDSSLRYRYVTSGLSANNGIWHHVCCTISDDAVTTYLDGNKVTSKTFTEISLNVTDITSANFIEIGCDHSGGDERLTGYVNDFRIYDHALSAKEVKELSKGLVCHYPLNQAFPIDNLVRNQTYVAYNNYSSSGSTATLVKTGKRYNDCDIYRLTYTPNDTSLNNVKTTLHSHGIYGFSRTFKANTKYCFWILWRAISHPDTVCGGTASNIGGWTEIPTKKFSGEWNIVGQYRNGTVTTDKGDNIFTSFKTPSATSGTPIIIDFCCPHLVEGYDYILEENDYGGDAVNKIYDTSGYGNDALMWRYDSLGNIESYIDSPRNSLSTYVNSENNTTNTASGTVYVYGNCELTTPNYLTLAFWCKPIAGYFGGTTQGQICLTNIEIGNNAASDYLASPLNHRDGGYDVNGSDGTTHKRLTVNFTANEWHHYVVVYNGRYAINYKDGVQTATVDMGSNMTLYDMKAIVIGFSKAGGVWRSNKSYYSDFRLYSTALSEEDIKELYNIGASIDKNGNMFAYEFKED